MKNHVRNCKATILLEELQPMMHVLLNELASKYKSYENNELIQQATLLDPRFKRYGLMDINKVNLAIEILKSKVKKQKGENVGALEHKNQEISIQTNSSSSKIIKIIKMGDGETYIQLRSVP
ncbi:hypothetical protein NQ317_007606 [Molorchus minor]|uniref:Uncharacterized protein n=1 Tax=Molorchus minor TaxID=1323400 RepID=A0ABQ9JPN0_9CUCU|nr:hypothetical protein NQ317_007606 [Molorchus minor]